jgi:hypothetical protein
MVGDAGKQDETGPHLMDDIGASDELPENGKYRRIGEARLINLAFVDLADNVQGELPAHVVTASELRGKKIARMIQCAAHDPQTLGIIDMPDAAGRGHSGLASTLTARCAVSLFDPPHSY